MDVLQAPIHPQAGAYRDTVVRAGRLPTLPQIDSKGHPIRGAGADLVRGKVVKIFRKSKIFAYQGPAVLSPSADLKLFYRGRQGVQPNVQARKV